MQSPTYKPRYAIFADPPPSETSRRPSDRPEPSRCPSDKSEEEKVDSAFANSPDDDRSEWINPKALLVARAQGMSETEAYRAIHDRNQAQQHRDAELKAYYRRTFMFGNSFGELNVPGRPRPVSVALPSAADLQAGGGVGPFETWAEKDERNARRRSRLWMPPRLDRTDWAQLDEAMPDSNREKRLSVRLSTLILHERPTGEERPERPVAPFRPRTQVPALKGRPLSYARASDDSAVSLPREMAVNKRAPVVEKKERAVNKKGSVKNKADGKEKGGTMLRLKKSLRNLFGRRTA